MDDRQLIREYAGTHSETAFRTVVTRHLNHVHATAFRLVRDSQMAEDITQAVFILLARKAAGLASGCVVGGWLYRTTRFVAARALRAEQRRRLREQEAFRMQEFSSPDQGWQRLAPLLDEALDQLGDLERNALILRFFQEKPLESVGAELGLSEEAARKRVGRAVEKLRTFFARRGVSISAAALVTALAHHTAEAAPVALGTSVASAAMAHASGVGATLPTLAREVMSAWKRWTRVKLAVGFGTVALVSLALLLRGPSGMRQPAGTDSAVVAGNEPRATAGISEPAPATEPGPSAATPGAFSFGAVDAETGLGIAGARAMAVIGQDQDHLEILTNLVTDSQGRCDVPIKFAKVILLAVGALADGYEERCFAAGGRPEEIPSAYTLKLPRGSRIGGLVQDESGSPVAGAGIYVQFYGTGDAEWREFQRERPGFPADDLAVAKTDEAGHWTFGSAPATSDGFSLGVKHPDFTDATFRPDAGEHRGGATSVVALADLRSGQAVLVLKHGLSLAGQVLDEANRPLGGAKVSFDTIPGVPVTSVQTTPDGQFELKNLATGAGHVTVTLQGLAPERVSEQIGQSNQALTIQLKPGALLQVRVVDARGLAVDHARVQLQAWRGHNTLEWGAFTDAEGRVTWNSAPRDELNLVAMKDGFFYARDNIIVADGQEHTITLHPQVTVSGLVTDAETLQPIPNFKAIPGGPQERWQRINTVMGTNGQYRLVFQECNLPLLVRFEAEGYEPAISEPVPNNVTNFTYNFALKKQDQNTAIHGVVLLPDGRPAAGAQLALCTDDKGVTLARKKFLDRGDSLLARADGEGRFQFPAEPGAGAIVAVQEQGFAQARLNGTNQALSLQLEPWGRVEGCLKLRNSSNAQKQIMFSSRPMGPFARHGLNLDIDAFSTQTDEAGNFVFDQVPPGDFTLYLFRGMGIPFSHETSVRVPAGGSTHVQIGGSGRLIKGRFVLAGTDRALDWSRQIRFATLHTRMPLPSFPEGMTAAKLRTWQRQYYQSEEYQQAARAARSFPLDIEPDGSFSVEDVPPGTYELNADVLDSPIDPTDHTWIQKKPLAHFQQEVVVPEVAGSQANDVLDLGSIKGTTR
jgi:RNA polymerase sigma factor (sigma-70 family)